MSSLRCLLLETEQGSGLSLCLLMTSLPQECPVQSFAYAGPRQPDLQPGSQPSMSASERLPRPHLPPHKIPHTSSEHVGVPLTTPTLQVCPALLPRGGVRLGAWAYPHSPSPPHTSFLCSSPDMAVIVSQPHLPGTWDCHTAPEGQSWTQGTGSWQLAR